MLSVMQLLAKRHSHSRAHSRAGSGMPKTAEEASAWATEWITSPQAADDTPAPLKPPKLLSERHFIPHYPAKAPLQQVKLGTFNEMREHERGLDVILARLESKKTQLTPNSPTLLDRVSPHRERPYRPDAPPSPYDGARHTLHSPFHNSPERGGPTVVQEPEVPYTHALTILEKEPEKKYQRKRVEYQALIEQAEHRIARHAPTLTPTRNQYTAHTSPATFHPEMPS